MSKVKNDLLRRLLSDAVADADRPLVTSKTSTVEDIAAQTGYSTRQVWRAAKRFLDDGSLTNRPVHQLTDEETEAIAASRGNVGVAYRTLVKQFGKSMVPSQATLRRAAERDLGRDTLARFKLGAKGYRATRIYLKAEDCDRNQQWQTDHAHLPLRVLLGDGSIVTVWITTIIDAGTRMLMSYSLSIGTPNTDSIKEALVSAIFGQPSPFPGEPRIGGVPDLILYDRGADFVSEAMQESYDALMMIGLALPPYSPHRKGKVERLNRTIKEECIDQLPGVTRGPERLNGEAYNEGETVDFDVLAQALAEFAFDYNFVRVHDSLGVTPYDAWRADNTPLRSAPPDVIFDLMSTETRKVTTKGVSLFGAHYKFDALATASGAHVEVRYLPWDLSTVEIFRDNRHLGTAIHEDLMTHRQRQGFLKDRQAREVASRAKARLSVKKRPRLPATASPSGAGATTDHQNEQTRDRRVAAAHRVLHRTGPSQPTQQTLAGL